MANVVSLAPLEDDDRFAIVVSEFNRSVTERLLEGALASLGRAGVADARIDVAWVPGAWELPVVAKALAGNGLHAAVICLGAVIKGETTHDEHINRGVSLALAQIALEFELPVLLGLLTCHTMQQAVDRAGGNAGNKGSECAEAALHMVRLLRSLQQP